MDNRAIPVNYPGIRSRLGVVAEPDESALVATWLELRFGAELTTTSGQTVIVLEPGRRNSYGGPDILDVSLFMNGEFIQGAVECHTHPQAWFAHGHADDPAYANVILHVVGKWKTDWRQPNLPHIVLPTRSQPIQSGLCRLKGNQALDLLLERLAQKRWQGKVQKYRKLLPNPADVKHRRLIDDGSDLIGTKGNAANFRLICRALDIARFCSLSEEDQMASLTHLAENLNIQWQTRGIRPAARALKRLPSLVAWIHISRLLVECREFQEPFVDRIKRDFPGGLAVELLGNIVLPFQAARAFKSGDFVAAGQAEIQWRGLRLPAAYGCWQTRFGTFISQRDLKKFWISQALFELDKSYCKADLCFLCGLD